MLKKYCEVVACDGVADLYQSKDNKKHFLFWSIVTISMIGCSIFFTYRTIIGYIETPTVTNVDAVTGPSMKIPEVLISYNGGLNLTAMTEANLSEDFIHSFSASFSFKGRVLHSSLAQELNNYAEKNNLSSIGVAKKFGYACEDIIADIVETDFNHTNCTKKGELFLTDRGNSYIFRNLTPQWYPGLWGGVTFTLKGPSNPYVKAYPDVAFAAGMNDEFSITLEDKIGHFMSGRSYIIPMNSNVGITLNPKLYKRINCTRQCASTDIQFTSNTCFYDCYIKDMMACSSCLPFVVYGDGVRYNESQICNPFEHSIACIVNAHVQLCNEGCLPLCEEWIYEVTVSSSPLRPTPVNGSMSIVVIGYNTMQYTRIEEVQAFTIDMAISNVGGQPGLWLGLSVVTIFQTCYYFVLSLFRKEDKMIKALKPVDITK